MIMEDDRLEEWFKANMQAAAQWFESDRPDAAAVDAVKAASYSWAIFRGVQESEPDRYGIAWEELAKTLRQLPPSVLRRSLALQGLSEA